MQTSSTETSSVAMIRNLIGGIIVLHFRYIIKIDCNEIDLMSSDRRIVHGNDLFKHDRIRRATPVARPDDFPQVERDQLLTLHNNYRAGEGASNMEILVGDIT